MRYRVWSRRRGLLLGTAVAVVLVPLGGLAMAKAAGDDGGQEPDGGLRRLVITVSDPGATVPRAVFVEDLPAAVDAAGALSGGGSGAPTASAVRGNGASASAEELAALLHGEGFTPYAREFFAPASAYRAEALGGAEALPTAVEAESAETPTPQAHAPEAPPARLDAVAVLPPRSRPRPWSDVPAVHEASWLDESSVEVWTSLSPEEAAALPGVASAQRRE